jgi:DNA-binding response OmpR family regulator
VPRMLLAEQDESLAYSIRDWFTLESYEVELVKDGLSAVACLSKSQFDIIIMETILPGIDGLTVCRTYRINRAGSAPVVMVAANQSPEEIERCLEAGADHCVAKPFRLQELSARVKAILRRPILVLGSVLHIRELMVDPISGDVSYFGKPIHLHPMEFKLLEFFMHHPNQVFSTEALLGRIWQDRPGALNDTVRTHIKTLRRKINSVDSQPLISTVRGRGYKFDIP